MTELKVEILSQKTCYQGFFRIEKFSLRHSLFNGGWSQTLNRELFERGHAAGVLPYDPIRDEIILIEQFRIGAHRVKTSAWLLEIVAGMIEPGETAEDVVKRESIEEAGCTIMQLAPVCNYLVSPGGTSETMALFCGQVDASNIGGIHGITDEGEDIRVTTVSFNTAIDMLNKGMINSAAPIIALQWLIIHREKIQKMWGASETSKRHTSYLIPN